MTPTLLIILGAWIGLNLVVFVAIARRTRGRPEPRLRAPRRASYAAPVDGYASLLLSRLIVQTCRVAGTPEACVLLRDTGAAADTLVPVASHGLDEALIGRRIAIGETGWRLELVADDGTRRDAGAGAAVPIVRSTVGDCGYLWAAAPPGAQLGDRQLRLLAELADLCGQALDDLEGGARLDEAIGRALALIGEEDEPTAAGRHAALARSVGERLGLDGAGLIELDIAARVQHAVPIAPASAVRALPGFESVAIVLRFAHERWDGAGPHGLRGDRIPLASRILGVCEALGVPFDQTLRSIQGASGQAFDPAVVTALSVELLGPVPDFEEPAPHWADGDRLFAL
jgi:hypothetical protein